MTSLSKGLETACLIQGHEQLLMEALRRWVSDEYRDKKNQQVDTSEWPIRWVYSPSAPLMLIAMYCKLRIYRCLLGCLTLNLKQCL